MHPTFATWGNATPMQEARPIFVRQAFSERLETRCQAWLFVGVIHCRYSGGGCVWRAFCATTVTSTTRHTIRCSVLYRHVLLVPSIWWAVVFQAACKPWLPCRFCFSQRFCLTTSLLLTSQFRFMTSDSILILLLVQHWRLCLVLCRNQALLAWERNLRITWLPPSPSLPGVSSQAWCTGLVQWLLSS